MNRLDINNNIGDDKIGRSELLFNCNKSDRNLLFLIDHKIYKISFLCKTGMTS